MPQTCPSLLLLLPVASPFLSTPTKTPPWDMSHPFPSLQHSSPFQCLSHDLFWDFSFLPPFLLSLSTLFLSTSKEYTVQIPQDNISKTVQLHLIRHRDLLRINVAFWFFAEEKGITQFPELFACWWLLLFPSPNRYGKLKNQLQLEGKLI